MTKKVLFSDLEKIDQFDERELIPYDPELTDIIGKPIVEGWSKAGGCHPKFLVPHV